MKLVPAGDPNRQLTLFLAFYWLRKLKPEELFLRGVMFVQILALAVIMFVIYIAFFEK